MSTRDKHEPKHRAPSSKRAPHAALRTSLTLSTMAVVATGLAVSGGSLSALGDPDSTTDLTSVAADGALGAAAADAAAIADLAGDDAAQVDTAALSAPRDALVSRSDRREDTDPVKAGLLAIGDTTTDHALTRTEDLSDEDPRTVARALLAEFGFGEDQFGCLDSLWERESHWNIYADNPSSSAYGIPQALPGSKMSSAGADWATNPVTQIRWGLGYIEDRYGSPCGAWGHSQSHGWY